MTISVKDVSPQTVGMLMALFERAGRLYESLGIIDAYHQPSVEEGKTVADMVIEIQRKIQSYFSNNPNKLLTLA